MADQGGWGPWIACDGTGAPQEFRKMPSGTRGQAQYCPTSSGITIQEGWLISPFFQGFFWSWRWRWAGGLRFARQRVCCDGSHRPITAVRFWRPKPPAASTEAGVALLRAIAQGDRLPASEDADARG